MPETAATDQPLTVALVHGAFADSSATERVGVADPAGRRAEPAGPQVAADQHGERRRRPVERPHQLRGDVGRHLGRPAGGIVAAFPSCDPIASAVTIDVTSLR